jgi:hypothetical protein
MKPCTGKPGKQHTEIVHNELECPICCKPEPQADSIWEWIEECIATNFKGRNEDELHDALADIDLDKFIYNKLAEYKGGKA